MGAEMARQWAAREGKNVALVLAAGGVSRLLTVTENFVAVHVLGGRRDICPIPGGSGGPYDRRTMTAAQHMTSFTVWRQGFGSHRRFAGAAFVFAWFFIGGLAHFFATDIEMSLVPPYIPWPREAVYASGLFELLGAAGLLLPRTRCLAGAGLFLLTLAVTPVHVYMLQRPDLFAAIPYWLLVLRLPLQALLLALIAWSVSPSCTSRVKAWLPARAQ